MGPKHASILTGLLFLLLSSSSLIAQSALTAEEIIRKADEKVRGKTNQSEMRMEIIRPTWQRDLGPEERPLLGAAAAQRA